MRINKFIAEAGVASRRKAEELVSSGQVKVNDKVCRELATIINPDKDTVSVNGKIIKPVSQRVVYLLNKPRGVVTTADDPEHRQTVIDFVPNEPRVFPCGRLDAETMGLVVLTNDGNLCYQLTHPKFEHRKEYRVVGTSKNPQDSWGRLQRPIKLKDGPVTIDTLKLQSIHHHKINFAITIHDGRNRIIRRLCSEVGIEVSQLTRTKLGHFELGDLEPGKYKTAE